MDESEMTRQRTPWPSDPRTPHLRWDRDRNGNDRCYCRNLELPGSAQARLREAFGTPAFIAEYEAAHAAVIGGTAIKKGRAAKRVLRPQPAPAPRHDDDTRSLGFLIGQYYHSPAFLRDIGESTRVARRRNLDRMCAREIKRAGADGKVVKVKIGAWPFAQIDQEWAGELRDDYEATPGMALEIVEGCRQAFKFALGKRRQFPGLTHNPFVGLDRLAGNAKAAPEWGEADMATWNKHAGTRRAEWMIVLRNTGVRISDAVELNDDMIMDAIDPETRKARKVISFIAIKGAEKRARLGKDALVVTIPILPELAAMLANQKRAPGVKHWLLGMRGRPVKSKSVTAMMGRLCKKLGLSDCSPHAVRRAGAALAATKGASHADMMAIFGWETMAQADRYIKRFKRSQAALRSMHHLERSGAKEAAA